MLDSMASCTRIQIWEKDKLFELVFFFAKISLQFYYFLHSWCIGYFVYGLPNAFNTACLLFLSTSLLFLESPLTLKDWDDTLFWRACCRIWAGEEPLLKTPLFAGPAIGLLPTPLFPFPQPHPIFHLLKKDFFNCWLDFLLDSQLFFSTSARFAFFLSWSYFFNFDNTHKII